MFNTGRCRHRQRRRLLIEFAAAGFRESCCKQNRKSELRGNYEESGNISDRKENHGNLFKQLRAVRVVGEQASNKLKGIQ